MSLLATLVALLPILAVLLTQLQLLWDASDGEVARWRGTSSPLGVFLD